MQKTLKTLPVGVVILPLREVTDMAIAAEIVGPLHGCLHDRVVETHGEQDGLTAPLFFFQGGPDFLSDPGARDADFGQS